MDLQKRADYLLSECTDFINDVEKNELTNEQWFINFEDALNDLSNKDHLVVE